MELGDRKPVAIEFSRGMSGFYREGRIYEEVVIDKDRS
jgi:hypothetical protein